MNLNRRTFLAGVGASGLATPFLSGAAVASPSAVPLAPGIMPAFSKRRVGAAEVTVLLDGTIDVGPEMIVGFDRDIADATLKRQHIAPFGDSRPLPVLGHVIEVGGKKIAVDTGTLPGFSPKTGGFHAALAQAGISATEIDAVLVTHLHPDHIGGLMDGDTPLFPNAELVVNQTEWEFWHGAAADALPEQAQPFVQIARNFTTPYKEQLRTFAADAEVLSGIQAVQAPGHTPGHVGYRLHSDGEDLLFWGDLIHLPRLQFDNPEWLVAFDMDPTQTSQSRKRVLDMAAADGLQVTGSHLEFPGFGYVDRSASGYGFVASAYDYSL